jgi:hypothetical protein
MESPPADLCGPDPGDFALKLRPAQGRCEAIWIPLAPPHIPLDPRPASLTSRVPLAKAKIRSGIMVIWPASAWVRASQRRPMTHNLSLEQQANLAIP